MHTLKPRVAVQLRLVFFLTWDEGTLQFWKPWYPSNFVSVSLLNPSVFEDRAWLASHVLGDDKTHTLWSGLASKVNLICHSTTTTPPSSPLPSVPLHSSECLCPSPSQVQCIKHGLCLWNTLMSELLPCHSTPLYAFYLIWCIRG